jgi:hypothetical protein
MQQATRTGVGLDCAATLVSLRPGYVLGTRTVVQRGAEKKRVVRRGFAPRQFQRLVGDLLSEHLFFGLVELENGHEQWSFLRQRNCCLKVSGLNRMGHPHGEDPRG